MHPANAANAVDFSAFRNEWLVDVLAGNPSTGELGRRFAHKLFTQWLDIPDAYVDLLYCDGPADGGIDIAYLERGEANAENSVGDTWYIVQSKFGSSHQGSSALLVEGKKVIDTLSERARPLSEAAASVTERIRQFLRKGDGMSGDR